MTLRLVVVCNEFPYPVIHGGRADVWRRLCAFKQAGVHLHLISWFTERHGKPDQEAIDAVESVVEGLDLLPTSLGPIALAKRAAYLAVLPPHASSRIPGAMRRKAIEQHVAAFRPDAVWLDGLYGSVIARRLSRRFGIPLLLRSHNIEHLYMRRQATSATAWYRRLALWLATLGLERFESNVHQDSRKVFDISVDDMQYWGERGLSSTSWLPPNVQLPELGPRTEPECDVLFLGNLNTPNNVESVRWLVRNVVPIVRDRRPGTTFRIAGSKPVREVLELCHRVAGVEIIADPTSPWPLYQAARVLVNPAQHGSGVQIKTVEMLHVPRPVISTSVGVRGLSQSVRELACIADTPQDFAVGILRSLTSSDVDFLERNEVLKVFSPESMSTVVREIERMVLPT